MKKAILATCAGVVWSTAAAGNLLSFDTDFETGTDGWIGSDLFSATPARVKDGCFGDYALMQKAGNGLRTAFLWDKLETNTFYTLSYSVKGAGSGRVKAQVVTASWAWLGAAETGITENWQRRAFTFRTPPDKRHRACYLWMTFTGEGCVLYDGFRLEKGSRAKPYTSPTRQFSCALDLPGEIHFEEDGIPVMRARTTGTDGAKNLAVRLVTPDGKTVAAAAATDGSDLLLPLPGHARSGYHPLRAELVDADGKTLLTRETPFVVTRRAPGHPFFGMTVATGTDAAALRRVGFEWLRGNTKFWQWEEHEKPRVFTGDEPVQKRRPDAFNMLGTTGGTPPAWARGKDRTFWCDDPKKALPFFRYLVRTTRDTVDQYEIINEPDLTLPREKGVTFREAIAHYCDILETVAPVIRAGERPVVIDVSGVREGVDFIEGVLKRTPESVDIVSLHPYSWPRELADDGRTVSTPETGGFLNTLDRTFAMLARYPKKRVVIGELGWALAMDAPLSGPAVRKLGWYLARMYTLARSFPDIEYFIWFSLGNTPENGRNDYCVWRVTPEDGARPTAAVAAACEAVRQLPRPADGPVVCVRRKGVFLARWAADGRTRFAFWTDEPAFTRPLGALDVPVRAARSAFGEPLDPRCLTFSEAPVYLETEPDAAEALQRRLIERLEALYATRARVQRDEITVDGFAGDDWRTYDFLRTPRLVALNRRNDVIPPDPTVQWDGPEDLSVRFLPAWDETNFYFFAAVTDDVHCVPRKGGDIFRNDSVQLAFDTLDDAQRGSGYDENDYELGLSDGHPLWRWHGGDVKPGPFNAADVTVRRSGNVTEYRAAVPWSALGLSGPPRSLGCAFAVQDNDDNDAARYRLVFGGGIADGKNPAAFKRLLLR